MKDSILIGQYPAAGHSGFPLFGQRPRAIRFVDLVFESDAVAVGRIIGVGPEGPGLPPRHVTLDVVQSFRRTVRGEMRVALPPAGFDLTTFGIGDTSMFFLKGIEGTNASLVGDGDVGIWPRATADWVFSEGHVQPLDRVASIVGALFELDSLRRYEERIGALTDDPFAGNALGQIAALQYVANSERWPENGLKGDVDVRTARYILCAGTLLEKQPPDGAAEAELAQLLPDLPLSVSLPRCISGLEHSDVALRDASFAAVETLVKEDFKYDARAAEESRSEAVSRYRKWFEKRQPAFLRRDVPLFLRDLRSQLPLRRQAANLLLRLISGRNVAFDANDTESNREAAATGWEEWWRSTEPTLVP